MSGIEFNRRLESIPVYPAADSYGHDGELVKLASNETPWGPAAAGDGGDSGPARDAQPLPRPGQVGAAPADRRAHGALERAGGGGQRLLRDPHGRRRRPARARRRAGVRVAVVLDLPASGGAVGRPGGHRAAGLRRTTRPGGDGERGHRRHAARAGLQPQQPHGHRASGGRDRRLRGRPSRGTWP